ncbi:hypothetical protein PAXRUDRAFT_138716 [Paxillus rubicundulus Ve08.2h10]|uniref:Autophagy-related protein 2 n=1 Tax=Paxillus rubicundulus Ve08.2h10 TaxID=930991 RepID=A0A0D0E4V3_9AGAM|nr:hypothetical protein PAXRUDRAFT_138716 [Paxillus rubicundulus Ve08.2h10]
MTSWYSSWFSGLPTFDFAVPSGIQRRFFSFILKRSLGRFLKPGQLDLHQIDSQLGSGTVQVKDLELDTQAINQLLAGLPFHLHDGFISGVTALVPFPNPLTSKVGLHAQSLNLTLHVTPEKQISSSSSSPFHNSSNLADSVTSVAESFIHDELTPREEATFRHSLRPSTGPPPPVDETDNLPGGFNPFVHNLHDEEAHGETYGDENPVGVSVFATLIERLLARFEFSAMDTKVTVVHPGRSSFTISIPEISYRTDVKESPLPQSPPDGKLQPISTGPEGSEYQGQVRTVSISGLKVTSRDLRFIVSSATTTASTLSPASPSSPRHSPRSHRGPFVNLSSRNSSSSSLDEETELMMSHSIAMLPPRLPSPASSVSSSMYRSAISTTNAQSISEPTFARLRPGAQGAESSGRVRPSPRISIPQQEAVEDVILSFCSKPLVIRLQTPSPRVVPHEQAPQGGAAPLKGAGPNPIREPPECEVLQLSVIVGTLACAFRSCHLRMLLDMVDACLLNLPTPPPAPRKEGLSKPPSSALRLEANITSRAVVIIVLSEPPKGEAFSFNTCFDHPLVPPRLPCTYVRLFLDNLSASLQLSGPSPDTSPSRARQTESSSQVAPSAAGKVVISEVSVFAFHSVSSLDDQQIAAPILITDHYLPISHTVRRHRPSLTSEKPGDVKLPLFNVVDWTEAKFQGGSAKLLTWRSRSRAISRNRDKMCSPSQIPRDLPASPNPFLASPLPEEVDRWQPPPAIEFFCQSGPTNTSKTSTWSVDIKIAPLHLFLDLGMIFNENVLMPFVDDITSAAMFAPRNQARETNVEGDQSRRNQDPGELSKDDEDDEADLRSRHISPRAWEREQERKRFEKRILEDLNLGMDYRTEGTTIPKASPIVRKRKTRMPSEPSLRVTLSCSMIRVEARCLPPPNRPPRSGCLLLDLRGLTISNNPAPIKPSLRFSEGMRSPPSHSNPTVPRVVLSARLQEILIGYSSVDENLARAFLTLGSLPMNEGEPNASALLATEPVSDLLPLSLVLGRSNIAKEVHSTPLNRLSLTVDVPLVNFVLDKVVFDGLHYWADDVAQLIERCLAFQDSAAATLPSRHPSLIGSRFFAQSRRSDTPSTDDSTIEAYSTHQVKSSSSETVVKLSVTEGRLIVPRDGESHSTRPFDISVLDVDALLELKPDGKEETVVSAGVMDFRITDTSNDGNYVPLLALSTPRSLSSAPRPMVKTRIISLAVPETTAKESRITLSLWGFTIYAPPDLRFASDLVAFAKAPPGVFESVVPSERTRLAVAVVDVSVHVRAPEYSGAAVLHLGEANFSTELVGNSCESAFKFGVSSLHFLLIDSIQDAMESAETPRAPVGHGVGLWKTSGYALVAEVAHWQLAFRADSSVVPPNIGVVIDRIDVRVHLCADTIGALAGLITNLTSSSKNNANEQPPRVLPKVHTLGGDGDHDMTASLDEQAFKIVPEVGSVADMIRDDLPANLDYLDASFGTAAGLRELRDDDLEDFDTEEQSRRTTPVAGEIGIVSKVGGETIRILRPFAFVEHYFDTIPSNTATGSDSPSDTTLRVQIHNSDIVLFLHDGFDWPRTRKIIEKEVKEMRKKLARIRQLVATGQTQEPIDEETSATLFNSFHIGLEQDLENMDPDALIAAIDDELDEDTEIGSQSSWQSLHPASPGRPPIPSTRVHGKRLTRSRGPSIEIRLSGLNTEIENYRPGETLVSRTLVLVRDLEILDHIKTSTWKKFLTDLRSDSRGNVRETDSNMARIELLSVRPSPSHLAEEARLRAKILPLRLYVDQDALDFFKKFFAFKDPDSHPVSEEGEEKEEIYFQHAEVFPVDIKLDYKPRRVDYRALREGKTIELMNFFHFDAAEMTLRHLTLHGITGWSRFFDTLNDLWTPDVKATQLVDVISGVAPIRSFVNVGSGVVDLVLLPIAQYKKDGRIVRGVQKGTKAFMQSTAMEAIKLGARLATGTQVILEQAESVLGGQFKDSITAETLQISYENEDEEGSDDDLISRYAAQPSGVTEGVQSAYRSLQKNMHSAAQTILAVPMEVYERSGDEGAVRAVVRAVPIAVLKPMIGASEAIGKTLMGLHNTLDPTIRHENEAKYKHR